MLLSNSSKTTNNVTELNICCGKTNVLATILHRWLVRCGPVFCERSRTREAHKRIGRRPPSPARQPQQSVARRHWLSIAFYSAHVASPSPLEYYHGRPANDRVASRARSPGTYYHAAGERRCIENRLGAAEERTSVTTADRPRLMLQRHPDGSCWCYATDA